MEIVVITVLLAGLGAVGVAVAWGVIGIGDGTARRGLRPLLGGLVLIGMGMAVPFEGSTGGDPMATPEPILEPVGAPPPPHPGMEPPPPHDGPAPPPPLGPDRLEPRAAIDSHLRRACAVDPTGTATCWGEPTMDLNAGGARVTSVAVGREHVCALRTDGRVICVGDGSDGQTRPPDALFTAISAGNEHTCGLTEAGRVACWGRSDGRTAAPAGTRLTTLSVGVEHSCGLDASGRAHCWGCLDETVACTPPDAVFTAISAGHRHTCALTADGSPICWGEDEAGQSSPPAGTVLTDIAAGWAQTCGRTAAGAITCWGCRGRLQHLLPDHVDHCDPPKGAFAGLSGGDLWGACAVTVEGQPTCWGGLSREGDPR